MSKKAIALLFGIGLVVAAGAIAIDGDVRETLTEEDTLSNVNIDPGHVRIYKNGELVAEESNVLMRGHEAIRKQLIEDPEVMWWNHIALADDTDGSTPEEGDHTLEGKYEDCGLGSQEYDNIEYTSPDGEYEGGWEMTATFTYDSEDGDCDPEALVETTAQRNDDLDGDADEPEYFAGTDFDRVIELHDDDELTVEWINEVQDA